MHHKVQISRATSSVVAPPHPPPLAAACRSQAEPQDSIQVFADALRSKGGIENRAAVLEGQRFELFRGKDLVRWVKAHPERGAAAAAGVGGLQCRLGVGGGVDVVQFDC